MSGEIRVHEYPTPEEPTDWEHYGLYQGVKSAIVSIPSYFEVDIQIRGIEAADLFGLGDIMGAAIEKAVVSTLNEMREVWDPNQQYMEYVWKRQPQTFPDAVLIRYADDERDPLMGIEVKTWYLLAKEEEASPRFETSQDACAKQDLIIAVPWHLENVVAGEPVVKEPWVESAQTAARYVDYHWSITRETNKSREIIYPEGAEPYPDRKRDEVQKKPVEPTGNNYGRLGRSSHGHKSIMDDHTEEVMNDEIMGIPTGKWIEFLRNATRD